MQVRVLPGSFSISLHCFALEFDTRMQASTCLPCWLAIRREQHVMTRIFCLRSESHSASAAYDFSYCLTWALQETTTPHLCAMRFSSLRYELLHNCAEAQRSVEVSCALFNFSLILQKLPMCISFSRAHGVVVSHPLRMRKALGSNPSVSISQRFAWGNANAF